MEWEATEQQTYLQWLQSSILYLAFTLTHCVREFREMGDGCIEALQ